MSILIKGMKMPESKLAGMATVYDAYIVIRDNGDAKIVIDNEDETGSTEYSLIKLSPHEDLIGRNAAIRSAFKGEQNIYCWDEIEEAIDSVPAIIESEE